METHVKLKTQSHAAFQLQYHLIFSIKYRHKVINAAMLRRLELIFHELLFKWRCKLIEFGGEDDHCHLLIESHPALDLSKMIGNIKAVSARKIREEFSEHLKTYFWKPYFWNKAYAVISVGSRANLKTLVNYIQNQEAPLN